MDVCEIKNGVLEKYMTKPKGPTVIFLDSSVQKIGEYAFSECRNVMEIILHTGLESIDDRAFANSCIKAITIPGNIKRIGKEAFANCKGLQYIEIPFSITEIEEGAFSGCINLKRVVFRMHVVDNAVAFESRIRKISARIFEDCEALQEIKIPENVVEIGEYAFRHCRSLRTITIPESVVTIGKEAFSYCGELNNIVFPKNISQIGDGALMDCRELENVILSCNISTVPKGMFARCLSLKNVVITPGEHTAVRRVEEDAFVYCEKLENVIFSKPLEYVGSFAFGSCKNLKHAPALKTDAEIGKCAFMGCENLDYITECPDEKGKSDRKLIYEFMLRAADNFSRDTDVLEMLFSWGDYNMKFSADRANYGIYSVYGCDEDGNVRSAQPFCTGSVDEIVKYLNDKNNVDEVLPSVRNAD